MAKKESVESTVRNIRRKTRKKYGAEEKIRIVLEGLKGESTIAELCRREGIAQTQGKIERWHRSMKNVVKSQNYYSPSQLLKAIDDFVEYYNNQRYHDSLDNMIPVSIYYGKEKEVQSEREKIKRDTMVLRRQQNLVPVGV